MATKQPSSAEHLRRRRGWLTVLGTFTGKKRGKWTGHLPPLNEFAETRLWANGTGGNACSVIVAPADPGAVCMSCRQDKRIGSRGCIHTGDIRALAVTRGCSS